MTIPAVRTFDNHTPLVDTELLPGRGTGVNAAHRMYEHLIGIWATGVIEAAHDLGAFTALISGPAMNSTVRSIETRSAGSVSTASPVQARRPGRVVRSTR